MLSERIHLLQILLNTHSSSLIDIHLLCRFPPSVQWWTALVSQDFIYKIPCTEFKTAMKEFKELVDCEKAFVAFSYGYPSPALRAWEDSMRELKGAS